MLRASLLILSLITPVFGFADAVRVALATEQRTLPLYLVQPKLSDNGLSKAYADSLWKVLTYDLNNNARTSVSASIGAVESSHKDNALNHPGAADELRKRQIFYLVKGAIANSRLTLAVFSLSAGRVHTTEPVILTGDLSKDRKRIHELADLVHQLLFDSPGVAATQMLYTVRRFHAGSNGTPWKSDVWAADWDGANARPVTTDGAYCVTPSFLPPRGAKMGAKHFLYVSYKTGQPKIYIAAITGGQPQRLTYLRGNQLMPAMNTARGLIAFISDANGNPDLFIQQFSHESGPIGKPIELFSHPGATQGSPTFSADGRRLAFVSDKDGSPRIYVMDIPQVGANMGRPAISCITRLNSENVSPMWSPDGKKIAYSAKTGGVRQIWIYDFATGTETQLTEGKLNKENPAWAPNSLHLLYNTDDNDTAELYLVDLNRKQPIKISEGAGQKRFPAWEPRVL